MVAWALLLLLFAVASVLGSVTVHGPTSVTAVGASVNVQLLVTSTASSPMLSLAALDTAPTDGSVVAQSATPLVPKGKCRRLFLRIRRRAAPGSTQERPAGCGDRGNFG